MYTVYFGNQFSDSEHKRLNYMHFTQIYLSFQATLRSEGCGSWDNLGKCNTSTFRHGSMIPTKSTIQPAWWAASRKTSLTDLAFIIDRRVLSCDFVISDSPREKWFEISDSESKVSSKNLAIMYHLCMKQWPCDHSSIPASGIRYDEFNVDLKGYLKTNLAPYFHLTRRFQTPWETPPHCHVTELYIRALVKNMSK